MIGEHIGQYKITRELGRGGMGVVYEVMHEVIGHRAAVKVLSGEAGRQDRSGEYAGRFFDEARAVNIVQHPGIVKIFDFGTLPSQTVYIMMELLEGESLWARQVRVRREGRSFPIGDALRTIRLVASALAAAHDKRIVHRDLKPENVFLVPDPDVPGGERTKVLDFGIARFLDSAKRRTMTGMVMGTALYMAPEQCQGGDHIDGKVDVYALGVMLYEMLCGAPPFEGEPSHVMVMQLTQDPPPLWQRMPALPEPVHRLVGDMMAKSPAARPTMNEVVARIQRLELDLAPAAPGMPTIAMPSVQFLPVAPGAAQGESTQRSRDGGPTRALRRRAPVLAAGIGGTVIAGLGLLLWLRSGHGQAPRPGPPAVARTVAGTAPSPPRAPAHPIAAPAAPPKDRDEERGPAAAPDGGVEEVPRRVERGPGRPAKRQFSKRHLPLPTF